MASEILLVYTISGDCLLGRWHESSDLDSFELPCPFPGQLSEAWTSRSEVPSIWLESRRLAKDSAAALPHKQLSFSTIDDGHSRSCEYKRSISLVVSCHASYTYVKGKKTSDFETDSPNPSRPRTGRAEWFQIVQKSSLGVSGWSARICPFFPTTHLRDHMRFGGKCQSKVGVVGVQMASLSYSMSI